MHFTHDWFAPHEATWLKHLGHLAEQPVRALEIGSYEGRSSTWMLAHILKHPHSHLTCIDLWAETRDREQFLANIAEAGGIDRTEHWQGSSVFHLTGMDGRQFDLIYIDGSHEARDVLTDACLAWPLLAPGGYLIFDDYLWRSHHAEFPPRHAIDAFLQLWMTQITVIHKGYQVILQRRA